MKKIIGIIVILIIGSLSAAYADELFIKSIKAPLYTSPDVQSVKIADLKQGDKVEKLAEKGAWVKIAFGAQKGWIIKYLADTTPPIHQKSLYGKYHSMEAKYKAFADKARRRPSSYASAAAARGLRDKEQKFGSKQKADYNAVEQMESIEIDKDKARSFLNEGIKNEKSN